MKCSASSIEVCLFFSVSTVWFGTGLILFLEEYDRVINLVETQCHVVEKTRGKYDCCDKVCSDCEDCADQIRCDAALLQKTATACCNSKTCCSGFDLEGNCVNLVHQRCKIECGICYTPSVSFEYRHRSKGFKLYNVVVGEKCARRDETCMEQFLERFPDVNGNVTCFYDGREGEMGGHSEGIWFDTEKDRTVQMVFICGVFLFCIACAVSDD